MSKKYLIKNLGIGDLIFFCGTILFDHNKGDIIEYCFDKNIINLYRENSVEYEKFCHDYLKFFLSDYKLKIIENSNECNFTWTVDYIRDNKILNNNFVVDSIKNKLNLESRKNIDEDYLVVFTKVRDLDSSIFSQTSSIFFEKLNQFNGKIILLGEREIKYTGEYAIHGSSKIYSIYNQCMENLNQSKVIDLTTKNYEFSKFSLESILNDCKIICNSNKTYIFGGGGFFCLSLFTDKLISLTNQNYKNAFYTERNKKLFSDVGQFKSSIINE